MNKKGFTLMELLFVIVIIAVISISSIISFGNIDDETALKDRANIYMDIQKSALLYIDLNDAWLQQFKSNGEIKIELGELKQSNYISFDVMDPVTNKEIPSNYMVQIYTAEDDYNYKYIDTCIVNKTVLLDSICNKHSTDYIDEETCKTKSCVANNKGEKKNCCEYYTGS